jgi:PAS domain S-box-containing protein
VLGYDPAELVDVDPLTLVHPDDRERVARFVAEAALRPGVTAAETWRVRHRDGTWLHSETVAANLLEDANVRGLVLNTRDVSDCKELEAQLVHQAFHDGLTGLANRTLFSERVTDAEAAAAVAARVLDTLHQPFGLNGRTIPIKASLGVATGRPGADEADELLRNADVAMYAAKAGGKDRYELFRPDMHEDMLQRLELEAELRHVADRDQLILHYQPIVELESGRITRVEALVRWDHPVKGLLPPPAFIPLAEEQGLIGPIGEWVLLQGCLQARRWQDQFPDAPPLSVHVNLSGRQLEEQRLVAEVVHALETSRLSPRQLTLEITESVLVSDVEAMSVRLRELKGLGVLLASTTSAPATRRSATCAASRSILKIDKAFVDGIGRGREDTALAHAIVKLSHTLQLHTVAEGIEQPEQAAHLVTLGCQEGQGFWFARPLDNGAMTELLATSLADGGFYLPVTRSAEAAVAT